MEKFQVLVMTFGRDHRSCLGYRLPDRSLIEMNHDRGLTSASARHGLTLLELMVVLVILAIVATVALQSLQPRVDSQRFQSATQLLKEIQSATLGPTEKYQIDGTPLISGFVADVGRLPIAKASAVNDSGSAQLSELWDSNSDLAMRFPFQFRPGPAQPTDYSKIRLPCGWRGPYLQLPIGLNLIRDPWGRPPLINLDDRGEAQQVQISIPPTSEQLQTPLLATELSHGKVEITGKVLLDDPESTTVRVVMLTPHPESSLTTLALLDDEDEQPDSFLFRNVPVGLRAIVVDANGKRQIKYVQVPHGGLVVCFDFQQNRSGTTN
jgi:prepilin-type N-terminal cleavage/methylation domain-containing protein